MSKIEWVGGYPRLILKEQKRWEPTHIVLFMIDGEAHYTDPVPLEVAEILNESLHGYICTLEEK